MRACEFVTESNGKRNSIISLRQLNREKHDYMRRKASLERRQRLIPLMYGKPGKAHERFEFEKARLELEQQKAELAATKAKTQAKTWKAISSMAKAGFEAGQNGQSKISSIANSEMRRRKD